jgi:hypothetical protein
MKKLSRVALLAIALIATTLLVGRSQEVAAQSAPRAGIKNVVLVHGAFADGSGWEAVAKTIEVNASHVAYMSHPTETAKLIEEAATSAHVNQ